MAPTSNLNFQPWTIDRPEETALKDILARVNFERGHFRDITESSLQEDIAAEGALELSSSEEDGDEEEDEEDEQKGKAQPKTREELFRVKQEMLQQIGTAHNEIMLALDFLSLLGSKDNPQAKTTMSEFLQKNVPAGTLGTDIWQRMPKDEAREAQDATLAHNVRMEGLQHSADKLLSAAKTLEDNVRKETEYWDQILSITEKGWNVCRLPGQHSRLGVRFGFTESARQFSARGIAALNPSSDGTIKLERGVGVKPKSLRVCISKDRVIVGRSYLHSITDDEETPLETRIRHARDSLYDEELYHEAIRESREMPSLGASVRGSTICVPVQQDRGEGGLEIQFDLVSLEAEPTAGTGLVSEEDALAQAVATAARLLLGHAYRERLHTRSRVPPPISERKEERPVMAILRPLMSLVVHRSSLELTNGYLETMAKTLANAKIGVRARRARFDLPNREEITKAEQLTSRLLTMFTSEARLEIYLPDNSTPVSMGLQIETELGQRFGSTFIMTTPEQKKLRFDSAVLAFENFDGWIVTSLAQGLATLMGKEWSCSDREGLLSKRVGLFEAEQLVQVDVKKGDLILDMSADEKSTSWTVEGTENGASFWDSRL